MITARLNKVKSSKLFYRGLFRRLLYLMIFSVMLNIIFVYFIYREIKLRPGPNYYATSGVSPPIELKALSHPNYSSTPLLKASPATDEMAK